MHNYGPDCCIQSTSYFQKLKLSGLTATPTNWKNTWQHPQACMCLIQLSTGQDGMRAAVLWLVWHWITCPSPVSIIHFDLFFFVLIIHPAPLTEVEHTFSWGHLMVSQVCHSLSDKSTRAALCFLHGRHCQVWCWSPLLYRLLRRNLGIPTKEVGAA